MAVTAALPRHCSSCGLERPFEQPPCSDGHGGDCPEWGCIDCGAALLLGLPPIDAWLFDDLPLDDLTFEVTRPARREASGSPSRAA